MFPLFSTKMHGIIDYMLAAFLFVYSVINFEGHSVHSWLLIVAAVFIFLMTLSTKFECGFAKLVTIPAHLTSDIVGGAILAACPLFFEYGNEWHTVELIAGLAWMGMGICTRPYMISDHIPVLSPDREGNPPE